MTLRGLPKCMTSRRVSSQWGRDKTKLTALGAGTTEVGVRLDIQMWPTMKAGRGHSGLVIAL